MAILASNGSKADVQLQCNNAVNGDTVTIPAGPFSWAGAVEVSQNAPKNITLQGAGPNSTIITSTAAGGLIRWETENSSNFTARMTGMTLDNSTFGGTMFNFSGNAQAHIVSGVVKSGLRIDHCIFTGTSVNAKMGMIQGWINGVMDHCIINNPFTLTGPPFGETLIINHETSPTGTGSYGDYSWFAPHTLGTIDAFYLEDCIFLHNQSVLDTQNIPTGGGSRYVARHCTSWGSMGGGHGCRESGVRQRGQRSGEVYKCHFLHDKSDSGGRQFTRWRDGEGIAWGNRYTFTGGLTAATTYVNSPIGFFNYSMFSAVPGLYFQQGPDGTSGWDKNQKGSFSLATPYRAVNTNYTPDATYTTTSGSAFGAFASNTIVAGVETGSAADKVVAGDVYLHGQGATRSGDVVTITGITATANQWSGFVLRDTDMNPTSTNPPAWGFIASNTATSSGNTTFNISPTNQWAPQASSRIPCPFGATHHWEIRKVQIYFNIPGNGSVDSASFADGNNSVANVSPAALVGGTPNPRWVNQTIPGTWQWENKYTVTDGAFWVNVTAIPGAGVGLYGQTLQLGSINNGTAKPGYTYAATAGSSSNQDTRVGADTEAFNILPSILSSFPNAAPFYDTGTGGFTSYPHPLVGPSTPPPANTITVSALSTSVTEGNTATFTISDTSAAPGGGVVVTYTFVGSGPSITAVAGTDYTAPYAGANGTATIAAGTTSKDVTVDTLQNPASGDRSATFTITAVSAGSSIGSPSSVILTIKDTANPAPTASLSVSPTSVVEGNGATYTVTLSSGAATDLTINYSMSGTAVSGTNYSALSGSASLTAGSSTVNISISTINVGALASSLTAIMTITSGTGYTPAAGTAKTATLTITQSTPAPTLPPPTIVVSA